MNKGPPHVQPRKKAAISNPFYAVLVVVGTVFVITACAYGMMAFRAVAPQLPADNAQQHPLLHFMDAYGSRLLMIEIGLLAFATFAAIGTDDYWTRRGAVRGARHSDMDSGENGNAP